MSLKVHLLHIPKTGGMTFYRALQQAGMNVTRSHDPAQVPDDALVVTLLRNPIDRVWSLYRYALRQGAFEGALSEFLQQPFDPWWWGVRNVQAQYMRPGVMIGTTETLPQTLERVCAIAGVSVPANYEWFGKQNGAEMTMQDYRYISAAINDSELDIWKGFMNA